MYILLSFYDGCYLCKNKIYISDILIIFTYSAIDKINVIIAINMGFDECISKAFDINYVLFAKIQALLRREHVILQQKSVFLNIENNTLKFNDRK